MVGVEQSMYQADDRVEAATHELEQKGLVQ